jgi:hypothetical protein
MTVFDIIKQINKLPEKTSETYVTDSVVVDVFKVDSRIKLRAEGIKSMLFTECQKEVLCKTLVDLLWYVDISDKYGMPPAVFTGTYRMKE